MRKQNCWEFAGCGREPGGTRAAAEGVCPAASERRAQGLNGGKNGGRACWAIAGTFSRCDVAGTHASRIHDCMACVFFRTVGLEEGDKYLGAKSLLAAVDRVSPAGTRRPHTTAHGRVHG